MISRVFIFGNGMVATVDENGEQIPELQGIIFDVMQKIGEQATEETKFFVQATMLDVDWFFKKRSEQR